MKAERAVAHRSVQIASEHRLAEDFFVELLARGAFVPPGRVRSYALGLLAGLRGDLDVSAHLLFLQFEHCVRELFFANGVVTTTSPTKDGGSQNESDLNKLFEHSHAPRLLGADALFDLRVLLTEKAGHNLRNSLAHGLLDDGAAHGSKRYFCWICLRFALLPLEVIRVADEAAPGVQVEGQSP